MVEPMFTRNFDQPVQVGSVVDLTGAEAKHAVSVRRMRVGEAIQLTDKAGLRVRGLVDSIVGNNLHIRVSSVEQEPTPQIQITLIQALAKGDRDELAVQAATELGVVGVIPWEADRSVSRWIGIKEAKGFGGFPISGQFLRTTNPAIVARHQAKVYGKASVGAPPMSVPHLDTRVVDGEKSLLFGPFAGFTPKFLKQGSWFDLPGSIRLNNIMPMVAVGATNLDLLKYLIGEVVASPQKKLDALREFFPDAQHEDWELITAGQRVQVMKKDPKKVGVLQFGTEVIAAGDGSIAGLLGASPGASVSVPVMLDVLKKCFPTEFAGWEPEIKKMIPSFGTRLSDTPAVAKKSFAASAKTLKLSV